MAARDITVIRCALPADSRDKQRFRIVNDNFEELRDQIERLKLTNGLITVGTIEHGELSGLGDDDHNIYHTDGRALIWLGTRSTTDLPEGTNLYYTDVRALAAWDGRGVASGDITYFDGSNWVVLAKGTDTQLLTLTSGLPAGEDAPVPNTTPAFGTTGGIGYVWVGGFPLEIV